MVFTEHCNRRFYHMEQITSVRRTSLPDDCDGFLLQVGSSLRA